MTDKPALTGAGKGPVIRSIAVADIDQLRYLDAYAVSEGFRFLGRFLSDLDDRSVTLDAPGEFFLGYFVAGELAGIGGVTPDPYIADLQCGRVRHVYVRPDHRRRGVGRELLRAVEARALLVYSTLRLRTDNTAAAKFYEALGYEAVLEATATHVRRSALNALR